ncbi:MAG: DUF1700 domain-containing protein [Lachnospiraceae bacterium]|nr:DUF1700 domain-containing protein [Lachnospiraceae bacterium]
MNRLEFMKELAKLLEDLPKEEKIEVLKYYNGYFDDAGKEQEAAIIEELGSPAKVAASVKAGMDENLAEHMEFTEKGVDDEKTVHEYEESRGQYAGSESSDSSQSGSSRSGGYYEEHSSSGYGQSFDQYGHGEREYDKDSRRHSPYRDQDGNGWRTIAIVMIIIITFPVWIGLLGGMIGLAGGLFGGLIGICGAAIGSTVGVLGAAIGCLVHGFAQLFVSPLEGMMSVSMGILLMGIGLLLWLLCSWVLRMVFGRLFPGAFRLIGRVFSWIGGLFGRIRA